MTEHAHGTVLGKFSRPGEDGGMRGGRSERPPEGEQYARVVGVTRLWGAGYEKDDPPQPKAVLHIRVVAEDGRKFDQVQRYTESMFGGDPDGARSPSNMRGVFTGLAGRELTAEEAAGASPGDLLGVIAKVVIGKGAKGGFKIWSWAGVSVERAKWVEQHVPDADVRGFKPSARTMAWLLTDEKKAVRAAKRHGIEIEPCLVGVPRRKKEAPAPPEPRPMNEIPAPPVQMPEPEEEAPAAPEKTEREPGDEADDEDYPF